MCFKARKKICPANISKITHLKCIFAEFRNLVWKLWCLISIIFIELAINYYSCSFKRTMYFTFFNILCLVLPCNSVPMIHPQSNTYAHVTVVLFISLWFGWIFFLNLRIGVWRDQALSSWWLKSGFLFALACFFESYLSGTHRLYLVISVCWAI